MPTYHVRFTPYDISGYTFEWMDKYKRYLVFRETKDKYGRSTELHYHMFIDDIHQIKTIRDDIKSMFKIPKVGRGEGNRYYAAMPWDTPAYVCKWNDQVASKGFSEKEVLECVVNGKKKHLYQMESSVELSGETAPAARKPPKVNTEKEIIADLIAWYINYKKDNGHPPSKQETVRQACSVVRSNGKGINMFKIRDYIHAVWFDTEDNADFLVNKISAIV